MDELADRSTPRHTFRLAHPPPCDVSNDKFLRCCCTPVALLLSCPFAPIVGTTTRRRPGAYTDSPSAAVPNCVDLRLVLLLSPMRKDAWKQRRPSRTSRIRPPLPAVISHTPKGRVTHPPSARPPHPSPWPMLLSSAAFGRNPRFRARLDRSWTSRTAGLGIKAAEHHGCRRGTSSPLRCYPGTWVLRKLPPSAEVVPCMFFDGCHSV